MFHWKLDLIFLVVIQGFKKFISRSVVRFKRSSFLPPSRILPIIALWFKLFYWLVHHENNFNFLWYIWRPKKLLWLEGGLIFVYSFWNVSCYLPDTEIFATRFNATIFEMNRQLCTQSSVSFIHCYSDILLKFGPSLWFIKSCHWLALIY